MKPKTSLRSFLALAGSALLAVSSANANQYWDGTANGNLNNTANWGSDTLPTLSTVINFGGTNATTSSNATTVGSTPAGQTSLNNDFAAGTDIKGIAFTNNGTTGRTQAFTLDGASIDLGLLTNDGVTTTAISAGGTPIEDLIKLNINFIGTGPNRVFNTSLNHDLKVDGIISGTNSYTLYKNGAGKLTLTNANNSYAGGTHIVGGGVLAITSIANGGVGNNSSIGASSKASANLQFAAATTSAALNTLRYIGSTNGSTDRNIQLAGNTGVLATNSAIESSGTGTLSFTDNAVITFTNSGVPRNLFLGGDNAGDNVFNLLLGNNGAGVSTLTKQGVGKWILTNANSYTGATKIEGGTLQIGNGSTTGRLTATTSIVNDGNLTINRSDAFSQAADLGAGVAITGTGSFTQAGGGTTTLTAANNYTGITTVSAGTLKLGNADVIPNASAVTIGGATTAGNLDINGFSDTLGTGAGTFLTLGSNSTTVGGLQNNVVNSGGGSPVLAVAGALVYNAGAVGFNNGKALISANIDLAGGNRTWTINDSAAAVVDLEVSGVISGTGLSSISKLGTGTLLLSNDANTFATQLVADAGTVQVTKLDDSGNPSSLGTASFVRLGNNATATLEYVGTTDSSTNRQIQVGTFANTNTGNATILNNGAGKLTFSNSQFLNLASAATVGRVLTLGGGNTMANTISGAIGDNNTAGGGTLSLTKKDAGTWVLTGANTYTGATTIQAGSLVAGANSAVSTNGAFGNASSAIVLGNGSTLATSAPALLINGAYTVGRAITVGSVTNSAAYNATIGGSNPTGTSTYTGNITLSDVATKYKATLQTATGGKVEFTTGTWTTNNKPITIGSAGNTGTVILSNNIATSGGINVKYGTLALNSTFTGNMTVASGATLGGTGTIDGAVLVDGILSPGESIAKLTTGALTLNDGSTFAYEMDSTVVGPDKGALQIVMGDLTLNGHINLTLSPTTFTPNTTTLSLIQYTGSLLADGGFFYYEGTKLEPGVPFTAGSNTWKISYTAGPLDGGANFANGLGGHFITLTNNLTAIPEPGSLLALGCLVGSGALLRSRRRRRGDVGF